MIVNNSSDILIPAVKPINFDNKYRVTYGSNDNYFVLEGNILEEDLIKEMKYYKAINSKIDVQLLCLDFIDFLNKRGYTIYIHFETDPVVIDFLKV